MSDTPDLNGPVLPPPDGVESNLDNPPNGNALVRGLVTLFLVITLVLLLIRFYGRSTWMKNKNKPSLEDYVIIPAIGTFIADCVIGYRVTSTSGFFVHGWDFRLKDQAWFYFNLFLGTQLYLATMIFLKAAILLQWARIFGPINSTAFRRTCYIIAALNAIYYIINIAIECTSCTPRAYYWDKTISGGTCLDASILALTSAIINLLFDIAILILPQGVIWRLNLSPRKRFGVSMVFFIGILGCLCALLRIVFGAVYVTSDDYTYNLSPQAILCVAELTAGFVVFAAPAAPKPFLYLMQQAGGSMERLLPSTRRGSNGDRGKSTGTGADTPRFGVGRSLVSRKQSGPNIISEYHDLEGQQDDVPMRKFGSSTSETTNMSGQQQLQPPMHPH